MQNHIFKHRSIRKYTSQTIKSGLLNRIIEAGTRASTTGNIQLYSVVITQKEENKQRLAPFHFNQPMLTEAPVVLTICADLNRYEAWCKNRNADAGTDNLLWLLNATIDASLFAQNIALAAETEGLGICYLGTSLYNAPEISQALKLPKGVIPITTITMGYPDVNPPLTDRLPLDAVMHQEHYRENTAERINELFAEKENLVSSKQFVADNGKDNLAQVFTDVRYKRTDSEHFSGKLKAMLKAQGFHL
ncbi:MAG: nitroreductase family protein [Mangrovibacterium sp.]